MISHPQRAHDSRRKRPAVHAWVAVLVSLFFCSAAFAQTAEALMEALVKKGILSEQEAEDIKADLSKENRQYNKLTIAGRSVGNITIFGDFRGRYDGIYSDGVNAQGVDFPDRNRFRY